MAHLHIDQPPEGLVKRLMKFATLLALCLGFPSIAWGQAMAVADEQAGGEVHLYRQYVDGPYGQIHMRIGKPRNPDDITARPLILLHHSPGSSSLYQALIPLLATDRLVIAPDTPGYGQSALPQVETEIHDYANALYAGIRQITSAPEIDVFGKLTGSFIAVDLAANHPAIHRVMIFQTPVFTEDERAVSLARAYRQSKERREDPSHAWVFERVEIRKQMIEPGVTIDHFLTDAIDNISAGHAWAKGEIAAISFRSDQVMPRVTQPVALIVTEPPADLQVVGMPAQFLSGDAHGARTPPQVLRTLDLIPDIRRVELVQSSFWIFRDQAEEVAANMRAFFDE